MKKPHAKIRFALIIFMMLLILSGLTAFPLKTEVEFLYVHKDVFPTLLSRWISEVHFAIASTPDLVLYGTDWLAFAHIIIALFFIPVYLDPVKYKVNVLIGVAACFLVFPLAFVCGPIRGIPFFHQVIDCSFGFIGGLLLYVVYIKINQLETTSYEQH